MSTVIFTARATANHLGNPHLVTRAGPNFLFRGPSQDKAGAAPDPAARCDAVRGAGGPESYFLLDVNRPRTESRVGPDEVARIPAEVHLLRDHPARGAAAPADGAGYRTLLPGPAGRYDPRVRRFLLDNLDQWPGEPLVARVSQPRPGLDGLAPRPGARAAAPVVVYVHCSGGRDRTGEVIGAYGLRRPGGSWVGRSAKHRASCPCPACPGGTPPFGGNYFRAIPLDAPWLNQPFGRGLRVGPGSCT